jgi:hypothetical protein
VAVQLTSDRRTRPRSRRKRRTGSRGGPTRAGGPTVAIRGREEHGEAKSVPWRAAPADEPLGLRGIGRR